MAGRTVVVNGNNRVVIFFTAISFGIAKEDAVRAATWNPARQIGCLDTVGSIADGKRADFVVCDENLNRKAVWLGGKELNYK